MRPRDARRAVAGLELATTHRLRGRRSIAIAAQGRDLGRPSGRSVVDVRSDHFPPPWVDGWRYRGEVSARPGLTSADIGMPGDDEAPLPEHEPSDTVAAMGMHAADALPGADLVVTGLADLAAGRETIESLLVLQASGRLSGLGYEVPVLDVDAPEARMYELIEQDVGPGRAHGRYNALRRRLDSFIRSAAAVRAGP